MKPNDHFPSRREFVGTLTASAATLLAGISTPSFAAPADQKLVADAEEWFKKVKGKHRIIYDAPEPHDGFPIIWSWAFYQTNNQTGSPDNDLTAMVVLRHNGIPIAMEDKLWEKYKFGEVFKAEDPATKSPAVRNPFWKPGKGDFKVPGIGEISIGINELQESGVMFFVCDAAMTVYSAIVADKMKLDPVEVRKDWVAGLLPNIRPVPSGIWAVSRAQEHECAYCFVG